MVTNYKLGRVLFFLAFVMCAKLSTAQTASQRTQIQQQSNTSRLIELQQELSSESTARKAYAKQMALINGWEIKGTNEEGSFFELMDVQNGFPIYYITDNVDAAKSTRAATLHPGGSTGLNLTGKGITAHVWDGGVARLTHREFDGSGGVNRVSIGDGSTEENFHSGHVMGTILASGYTPKARGMAYEAEGISYDWTDDKAEMAAAAANGMLVSNHSYGMDHRVVPDQFFGAYIDTSRKVDEVAYAAPYYLIVKSAGNDGTRDSYNEEPLDGKSSYDKLTGFATAKNVLLVGNARDASVDFNGNLLADPIRHPSSSEGPTDDYRIKPDIMGNGYEVYSCTVDNDSSYDSLIGTSMAAPSVSGTLLLLQQYHNQLNDRYMRSSTLKGLALHTADDMSSEGPDATTGWGLMNAKKAAQVLTDAKNKKAIIQELSMEAGEEYSLQVTAAPGRDLKVSISWIDPAAMSTLETNVKTPVLINDLDVVVSKNGTDYFPWKLTGVTTNGKGDNDVDPYEQVHIPNASGTYTITVKPEGIITNSIQNYSLIVTGFSSTSADNQAPSKPLNLSASDATYNTIRLNWNASTDNKGVERYDVFKNGEFLKSVQEPTTVVTGLNSNTNYSFKVKAYDAAGNGSEFSNSINKSTTSGSGPTYCESRANDDTIPDYIKRVRFANLDHASGAPDNGYTDHTTLSAEVARGETHLLSVSKAWGGYEGSFAIAAWIDYNQDGDFEDDGEQIFTSAASKQTPVTGNVSIPSNAKLGVTRMRVSMKFFSAAAPCATFTEGEVEDYSIYISGTGGGSGDDTTPPTIPVGLSVSGIASNSFDLSWAAASDNKYVSGYKIYLNGSFKKEVSTTNATIDGLTPSTQYSVYVTAVDAAGNESQASSKKTVTTTAGSGGDCKDETITIQLSTDKYASETSWDLKDSSGNVVASGSNYKNQTSYTINECVKPGCYTFTIKDSQSDGMCCKYGNGSYKVIYNGSTLASGGEFSASESKEVCVGKGDSQAPTAPTGLKVSNIKTTTADLSWTASTDNVGVVAYEVIVNGEKVTSTKTTSASLKGLKANSSYSVTVVAVDAADNKSESSKKLSFKTTDDSNGSAGSFVVSVTTDKYGSETSWELKDSEGKVIYTGKNLPSNETTKFEKTLKKGCYKFVIYDQYKDGICCKYGNGSYSVVLDGKTLKTGGEFGASESTDFCVDGVVDPSDNEAPTSPSNLVAKNQTDSSFELNWTASSDNKGVTKYTVYVDGKASTTSVKPSATVTGLKEKTTYTVYVTASDKAGNESKASRTIKATTTGSASVTYCELKASNSSYEWIDLVQINDMSNASSSDNGYGDYTNKVANLSFGENSITASAGFASSAYSENWYLWIDYNQDGEFSSTELAASGTSKDAGNTTAKFTVPSSAKTGNTRMRVAMKFSKSDQACGSFSYGEVEDYTANISASSTTRMSIETVGAQPWGDISENNTSTYPNPAQIGDVVMVNSLDIHEGRFEVYDINGQLRQTGEFNNRNAMISVQDLSEGKYIVKMKQLGDNRSRQTSFIVQ